MSLPEEFWVWPKFELYILQSIHEMIVDEFFDVGLKKEVMHIKTE
jgi:hypothetical protein